MATFPRSTVTAAFAQERDAGYALRLIASSAEIQARCTFRRVIGEGGEVQMVVLEASLADPSQAERVETCMAGAHGTPVPAEIVAGAVAVRAS